MSSLLFEITGVLGVCLLLIAFSLNVLNKLQQNSFLYLGLNFIGAAFAAIYALIVKAYPLLVLESVWSLFALYQISVKLTKFQYGYSKQKRRYDNGKQKKRRNNKGNNII